MASCCLFLFFVFLKLISLSEEGCGDRFLINDMTAESMTGLIHLVNSNSLKEVLKCTMWKNKEHKVFADMTCIDDEDLEKKCENTTVGNDTMYVLNFRCLYAKVHNVNYSDDSVKSVFGDCQNFSSVIKTMMRLWNISANDGTSAETSISPKPTSTTSSPTTTSTTSSTTTSTRTATLTTFSPTSSMSHRTTMSTITKLTSPLTTTSTRSPPAMSSLTTESTAEVKTQLSNTATPADVNSSLACSVKSDNNVNGKPDTQTSTPVTWQTTFMLVLLILSVVCNIMQGLNSFLQKRRLNMNQMQTNAECISLNPDATEAEKSPEKSLSYSNETVH